jgi:hypothetical protein
MTIYGEPSCQGKRFADVLFGFRQVQRNLSRGPGSLYHFGRRIEADRSVHSERCYKLTYWNEGGFLDQLIFRLGGGKMTGMQLP